MVIDFFMKFHTLGVVKDAQKMSLNGVWVTGLTQNFQQCRIRHKEEPWECQTLLLKIAFWKIQSETYTCIFKVGMEAYVTLLCKKLSWSTPGFNNSVMHCWTWNHYGYKVKTIKVKMKNQNILSQLEIFYNQYFKSSFW